MSTSTSFVDRYLLYVKLCYIYANMHIKNIRNLLSLLQKLIICTLYYELNVEQLCGYKGRSLQPQNGSSYSCWSLEERISGNTADHNTSPYDTAWNNLESRLSNLSCTCISFCQWVILTRKHAEIIVNDDVVFPMFQQHCQVLKEDVFLITDVLHLIYFISLAKRHWTLDSFFNWFNHVSKFSFLPTAEITTWILAWSSCCEYIF